MSESDSIKALELNHPNIQKKIFINLLVLFLLSVIAAFIFQMLIMSHTTVGDYIGIACICFLLPWLVGFLPSRQISKVPIGIIFLELLVCVMGLVAILGNVLAGPNAILVTIAIYGTLCSFVALLTCLDLQARVPGNLPTRFLSSRQWPILLVVTITCGFFTPAVTGGNVSSNLILLASIIVAFGVVWTWEIKDWRENKNAELLNQDAVQPELPVRLPRLANLLYRFAFALYIAGVLLVSNYPATTFQIILQDSPLTYMASIYPETIAFYVIIGVEVAFLAWLGRQSLWSRVFRLKNPMGERMLVFICVIILALGAGAGYGFYSLSSVTSWMWVAFIAETGLFAIIFSLLLAVTNSQLQLQK